MFRNYIVGVLVYPGTERFPLDEITEAIAVVALANELQSVK